jgi:hypothetical protein
MTSKKNRGLQLGGIRPVFLYVALIMLTDIRSTNIDSMRVVSKAKCIARKE